jgi:hypothetical protein
VLIVHDISVLNVVSRKNNQSKHKNKRKRKFFAIKNVLSRGIDKNWTMGKDFTGEPKGKDGHPNKSLTGHNCIISLQIAIRIMVFD